MPDEKRPAAAVSALASASAPHIFFDVASTWSVRDGVARVTLEGIRDINADGGPAHDFAVVCHLRMGITACRQLLTALQDVERIATEEANRRRDEAAESGASPPRTLN